MIKPMGIALVGHVARMRELRNAHKIVFGKPERMISLRIPRRRWKDNIKVDLKETGYDLIHLVQNWDQWRAPVITVLNLCVL
jgi:hypothetical protein